MIDYIGPLETAIVDRLTGSLELKAAARVIPWPDEPKEVGSVRGNALIMVRFVDVASPDPDAPTPRLQQLDSLMFELRLLIKGLRSHTGAYPVLGHCRGLLSAYCPVDPAPGYTPRFPGFFHKRTRLMRGSKDNGVWDFASLYGLDLIYQRS